MKVHRSDRSAKNRVHVAPAISSWRSPDGALVTIRAIRPDDASMTQQFVRELSPEARYFRFMGTLRELTPQMLERLVRIDQSCDVALVAITSQGGRERQLAECRYAVDPGGDYCEFALAVLDAWQRRGLGERLLSQLIDLARIRGLRSMVGEVLAANAAMLELALKLGFNVGASSEYWSVRRVSLALWPTLPIPRDVSQSYALS